MSSTGLIEDIVTYFAAGSTLNAGATLFAGLLPESVSNPDVSNQVQAAVVPLIGLQPVRRFVPSTGGDPAFIRPSYRVITRAALGESGHDDPAAALAVSHRLHDLAESYPPNSTVAGGVYGVINAVNTFQPPFFEDRDDEGRSVFAFNINVWA